MRVGTDTRQEPAPTPLNYPDRIAHREDTLDMTTRTVTATIPAHAAERTRRPRCAFVKLAELAEQTAAMFGDDTSVAEVFAADLADLQEHRPSLADEVAEAARVLFEAGQDDALVMLAMLPTVDRYDPWSIPDGWDVEVTTDGVATRKVYVGADEWSWDGRPQEEIALALVAFRTGVAAEHWTVTSVEPVYHQNDAGGLAAAA